MSSLLASVILCSISIEERVNKHKLSSNFNTKLTPKINKLKTSFI